MTPAIEISGLRKTFGSTRALDGLDLQVAEGEVHGFLGPNGSGKSTTLRILLGLMKADSGKAVLLGKDPWKDSATLHSRLAYVPGDVTLWPTLSGGEVIDLLGRLRGGLDPERRSELIRRFDLDPTKKGRAYSKGNRQKVALISALASNVELLLLDEPTSGLDPLMESVFRDCIREEAAQGRTVLLSSHILAEVEALCPRVSIIRKGRTVETGSLSDLRHLTRTTVVAQVREAPDVLRSLDGVFALRVSGRQVECEVESSAMDDLLRALGDLGVESLSARAATLEELFLRHYQQDSSPVPEDRVSSLVGTPTLVRLALRLDRIRLVASAVAIVGIGYGTASAFRDLYPTAESRRALASTLARTPALIALTGPGFNLSSIGGLTAWRIGGFGAVMVALFGIFTVTRRTRAQEESGRLELVGSGRVGRFAPLAAALGLAFGMSLLVGVALGAALTSLGEPAAGSFALGLGFASAGWAFAAVAAVTSQLSQSARAANGLAGAVLGAAFLLRAVGDSAGAGSLSFMSWLSPIGWAQQVRPFAGERWEVLGLPVMLAVACVALSFRLQQGRDLGEGLLSSHPGPPVAAASLNTTLSLAWRIHRGALAGWGIGLVCLGAVLGSLAEGVGSLVGDNPQLIEIFERLGGRDNLVAAYFASTMGVVGMLGGAYGVEATLRLRSEEVDGRAEPLLATRVSRSGWLIGHLVVVVSGTVVLLAVAGVSAALAHGLRTGDPAAALSDLAPAGLLQLPAVAAMVGLTVCLFGLLPRASTAAWGFLAVSVALAQLGPILQLPAWLQNISPFTHIPQVPVETISPTPLALLTLTAAGLVAAGMAGFAHRDIG